MKKILLTLIISMTVIIGLTGCGKKEELTDALKFKGDYEALNGDEYRSVEIDGNNPFIYTDADTIVKRIENKETFYVYFGSPYCPWCRSVIESAIKVAKSKSIDKIYYIDIWDGAHEEILRDTYKLNEDGGVELVSEGTKAYTKLLEYLDNVLSDYNLTDEDGKKVPVGEKRIFAPNFIYIEKGEAKSLISGMSEHQSDPKEKLTEEILSDQEKVFKDFFE